jgi:hypothetical protein
VNAESRLRRAEEQRAVGPEGGEDTVQHRSAQLGIEVDEDVAQQHDVDGGRERVGDQVHLADLDQAPGLVPDAPRAAVALEEADQVARGQDRGRG